MPKTAERACHGIDSKALAAEDVRLDANSWSEPLFHRHTVVWQSIGAAYVRLDTDSWLETVVSRMYHDIAEFLS